MSMVMVRESYMSWLIRTQQKRKIQLVDVMKERTRPKEARQHE